MIIDMLVCRVTLYLNMYKRDKRKPRTAAEAAAAAMHQKGEGHTSPCVCV